MFTRQALRKPGCTVLSQKVVTGHFLSLVEDVVIGRWAYRYVASPKEDQIVTDALERVDMSNFSPSTKSAKLSRWNQKKRHLSGETLP